MEPFALSTPRLRLDQPVAADVPDIARYCAAPVFERFMVTPWPYEARHARFFVDEFVPGGWSTGDEWTWAIREGEGGPMLGAVGVRTGSGMVGCWLGAEHRGRGVMPEALAAVVDAVFAHTGRDEVLWECVVGNAASARVAQKVGYRFTGKQPGRIPDRDGSTSPAWTARLGRDDDRTPQPGWPA